MATSEVLDVQRRDGIVTLTLNRPHALNALNPRLVSELALQLEQASHDSATRVLVITGSGGSFCSGADLRETPFRDADVGARLDVFHRIIRAIVAAPQPCIAAVDGPAVGFGADIALACDLRLLTTRAYLQEKFVQIGLMPDGGGTWFLPRLIGLGRALELLLLGDKIEAERARELGLTQSVVEPSELAARTQALAARLASGAPLAQQAIKRAVRANLSAELDAALAREKAGQIALAASNDLNEGVCAFIEKRSPVFTGS